MYSLDGKVAVVTGGASGIGKAVAERFAAAGAKLVLGDICDASQVAASVDGHFVETNVTDEAAVQKLMDTAADLHGRIDICVNNAGICLEASIADTSVEMIERFLRVNAIGVFLGMKHAVRHMRPGSSIVNTASLAAMLGLPDTLAYCASKAAVVSMTKVAALEFGPLGIRVNCVCPASVDTPMLANQRAPEVEVAVMKRASALGAINTAEQIAAAIHFLAADDCPGISGHALVVDGGCTGGWSVGTVEAMVAAAKLS